MATAKATTSAVSTEKRSTVKLDTIRNIEKTIQKQWAEAKIFEADAPGHATSK
jgi:leucyl-tRNA synthetase